MVEKTRFRSHEIWREPDTGFIHLVHVGEIDDGDAKLFLDAFARYRNEGDEPDFVIADSRQALGYSSGARKVFAANRGGLRENSYVAVFGMSFAPRAALNLLLKTLKVVSPVTLNVHMVADEAEARAWLTEKKRTRLARTAKA
ncbi:MAG TPA: hypothetical protein VM580_26965 [Labilithrix sp.]|nr:hypothetical protein [Labilithrix sp.]